jgi:WD40 repeat protein
VPARPALLVLALFLPAACAQDAGPPPREVRLDRNGYPLPPGAVAQLGVPRALSALVADAAWSPDGSRFVVADWATIATFDAATGRPVDTLTIDTAYRDRFAPLSRDGRLLCRVTGLDILLNDTRTGEQAAFRLPVHLKQQDRVARSLHLSADHRFLAGVLSPPNATGVAWRLDMAFGRFTRIVTGRADLHGVHLSPDGRRAYAVARQTAPQLVAWDLGRDRELWAVPLGEVGHIRAVSPDGGRLGIVGRTIGVFDTADGKERLSAPYGVLPPAGLRPIDFSPDGQLMAVSDHGEVAVWDVSAGKVRHRLAHPARAVAFSPDGKSLLTAGGWVQRWDIETGKPVYAEPVTGIPSPDPLVLQWSADGRRLLTGWHGELSGEGGRRAFPATLAVWDVPAMTTVWVHRPNSPAAVAALDPGGSIVRAFTRDGRLRTWRLGPPGTEDATAVADPTASVRVSRTFLPDGRLAVQTFTADGVTLDVYDTAGRPERQTFWRWPTNDRARNFGKNDPARNFTVYEARGTILFGPGGSRRDLVAGQSRPPLETRAPLRSFVSGVYPSADAFALARVVVGPGTTDGHLWEANTGRIIADFSTILPASDEVAVSDDGRFLASGAGDSVVVRDLADPTAVHRFQSSRARRLAFSPDSRHLAGALDDGSVLIWPVPGARSAWVAADRDRVWEDLIADDAGKAWKALWLLLDHPIEAVELLRGRLRPAAARKDTSGLIDRLDHARFAVREDAMRELARRGDEIEGDLRAALKQPSSPERRERLELLLGKLDLSAAPAGDTLRTLRCVWLLERINTADARRVLTELAGGAPGARGTLEAKAALERLGK